MQSSLLDPLSCFCVYVHAFIQKWAEENTKEGLANLALDCVPKEFRFAISFLRVIEPEV